jgi:hypothetical protein
MKHRAFAQTCRTCRKSRPLRDFTRPGSQKVNKTCLECLDARREGREPDVAPQGIAIYLPVTLTPEQRRVRRWWPSWVHAEDPSRRLNPRGADETRACAHCGAEYTSKSLRQKFCSKRCKSAWHRPAARAARSAGAA